MIIQLSAATATTETHSIDGLTRRWGYQITEAR
jgi:hypothetical protein